MKTNAKLSDTKNSSTLIDSVFSIFSSKGLESMKLFIIVLLPTPLFPMNNMRNFLRFFFWNTLVLNNKNN